MCEHLTPLDIELKARKIMETYRGQAWSRNCREWAYYDCVLELDKLKARYNFPDFITIHVNDDNKSGMEAGFYCSLCHDAIMGSHPDMGNGKILVE